jgi:hypothetical protein
VVQALPSSQPTELFGFEQPLSESQTSSVQTLPSPQSVGVTPTQLPPKQASSAVQASPSSQAGPVLPKLEQDPSASLHWSSVHTSPSLQTTGAPPWHIPAEQVSPEVQLTPSSQASELAACAQPLAASQLSSVQPLRSSQSWADVSVPTQSPAPQVSLVVQALPSSQEAEFGVLLQALAAQLSSVQPLSSSQATLDG